MARVAFHPWTLRLPLTVMFLIHFIPGNNTQNIIFAMPILIINGSVSTGRRKRPAQG